MSVLVFLVLMAGRCFAADLILYNGNIITVDEKFSIAPGRRNVDRVLGSDFVQVMPRRPAILGKRAGKLSHTARIANACRKYPPARTGLRYSLGYFLLDIFNRLNATEIHSRSA